MLYNFYNCLWNDVTQSVHSIHNLTLKEHFLFSGPNHICTKDEECVDNADCIPVKEAKIPRENLLLLQDHDVSICRCQEGYRDTGATCGGMRKWILKHIYYSAFSITMVARHR